MGVLGSLGARREDIAISAHRARSHLPFLVSARRRIMMLDQIHAHGIPMGTLDLNGDGKIAVFKELTIDGASDHLARVRPLLLARTYEGWRHSEDTEKQLRTSSLDAARFIAFTKLDASQAPVANLILWREEESYRVSNIVPAKVSALSIAEYNDLIDDFRDNVAGVALDDAGLSVQTSKAAEGLEDWVSNDVAALLKRFSSVANKSSAASHPLDEKRWMAFVIAAHLERAPLSASRLMQWLTEAGKWPEEVASRLAIQYEESRSILKMYDEAHSNVA